MVGRSQDSPDVGRGLRLPPNLEFVRILGSGGFGYVVQARDVNLNRDVAVKYVYGGALAGDGLARLLREGRALARLPSRAVVPVYEAVRVADDVALVMEFVSGGDLEQHLSQRALGAEERLGLLSQIATALELVHRAGIVHRDLKPANVLLTGDGDAKLADFGLARFIADAAAYRTDEGVAVFTPYYGAPEQQSDPDHETPRLDWYSFAVMAYRTMLGELPPLCPDPCSGRLGAAAFAAATALDPVERISPRELLALLADVEAEQWPVNDPRARSEVEETGVAASSPEPSPGSTEVRRAEPAPVLPPLSARPSAESDLEAGWVQPPVYLVPRRSPLRMLLPIAIGLAIGLVGTVVVVWLR